MRRLYNDFDFLCDLPIFSAWGFLPIKQYYMQNSPAKFNIGNHIYKQGDEAEYCYIIKSGIFKVLTKMNMEDAVDWLPQNCVEKMYRKSGQKKLADVGILSRGQVFGEEEIVFPSPRTSTVVCASAEGELFLISKKIFNVTLPRINASLEWLKENIKAKFDYLKDRMKSIQETTLANKNYLLQNTDSPLLVNKKIKISSSKESIDDIKIDMNKDLTVPTSSQLQYYLNNIPAHNQPEQFSIFLKAPPVDLSLFLSTPKTDVKSTKSMLNNSSIKPKKRRNVSVGNNISENEGSFLLKNLSRNEDRNALNPSSIVSNNSPQVLNSSSPNIQVALAEKIKKITKGYENYSSFGISSIKNSETKQTSYAKLESLNEEVERPYSINSFSNIGASVRRTGSLPKLKEMKSPKEIEEQVNKLIEEQESKLRSNSYEKMKKPKKLFSSMDFATGDGPKITSLLGYFNKTPVNSTFKSSPQKLKLLSPRITPTYRMPKENKEQ